jgi:hypothetical protein
VAIKVCSLSFNLALNTSFFFFFCLYICGVQIFIGFMLTIAELKFILFSYIYDKVL